jgi:tRNA pseudouridine32 synthase/23S rRNA pseudouridine746 synthase
MLIAHSKSTAAALSLLFRDREVEKRYCTIVAGDFSAQPNPLRVEQPVDGKPAVSIFKHSELIADGQRSVVDVRIESGRKHQIRRHLAGLGHPVIGDRLYGSGSDDGMDLQLTACLLAFQCPVSGERVEYRC